jgi:hypothetical protein
MAEPNPYAGDPYERLGLDSDASPTEVKTAAAAAKGKFNPDRAPPDRKSEFRELLYRIRDAEDAIINDTEPKYGAKPHPDGTPLEITLETTNPINGDTLKFLITDSDDTPIKNVEVTFDSETKKTNKLGQVEFTPTTAGSIEVRASKVGFDPVYEPASMTIEVTDRTPTLSIDASKTYIPPHSDIEVTVTDNVGDPVTGAAVTGKDIDTVTDSSGTTDITFPSKGKFEVTAEKEGFESDTVEFVVEKQTETVSLDYNPEVPYVDETITVSATAPDSSNIDIEFNEETKSLTESGEVQFETDSAGTFSIEASAADTEDTRYEPASTNVSVAAIPLEVTATPSRLPKEETTNITVREAHTADTVNDIQVTTSDGKKSSTKSGTASFEFHKAGEITITAGESSPRYESATAELEVYDETDLTIELSSGAVEPGEGVKITVRDKDGNRVENASVELDGETWTTNRQGAVRIEPETKGNHEIQASKDGDLSTYNPAKKTLRVGNPRPLRIIPNRDRTTAGDSVRVTVHDDRNDTTISGARVEAEHSNIGGVSEITDEKGQVSMTFNEGGIVTMTATKVIDGIEETSTETTITVDRTTTGANNNDPVIPIELFKNLVAKGLMMVGLLALIVGIGAVIVQGLSAAWMLGLGVFVSIISVLGYAQIIS